MWCTQKASFSFILSLSCQFWAIRKIPLSILLQILFLKRSDWMMQSLRWLMDLATWKLWIDFKMVLMTASKHVYYLGWNRSPAQVGCMRQVLGPDALRRAKEIGSRGRWEGGSGWGIHVNPWLIHVNVWQNPLQYCKVISLQLIKINGKKWSLWQWSLQKSHGMGL